MKTFLALAAMAACQFAVAQNTTELKSFRGLAISGNIDVTLVASKENKLVIEEGDPKGLKIGSDEGNLALSTKGNAGYEVTLYFNGPIEEIAVSGGVEITTKGTINGKNMEVSIAGGSKATLSLDIDHLSTAIASGSEMTLSGKAKNMEAAVASGGELEAGGFKTENSSAVVASGGEAKIYATGNVDATVASGGELTILGNPKKVNQVKADGAEINVVK